jgi:hypothetical protein
MSDKEDELESCINKDQEYKKDEDVQYFIIWIILCL